MYRMYRWLICLTALGILLVYNSWAAPPRGRGSYGGGGSSGGFGISIGGSQGLGFHTDFGNVSVGDNRGYRGGDYDRDHDRGYYGRDYYDRGNYGDWHGGSGLYFGGGSNSFHWGVGIPFGYDDYDWYAPYYNYYHQHYYNHDQDYYYPDSGYYSSATAAMPQPTEPPPVPTAGQVARLTDEQLRMMIAMALDSYSHDLDGFSTGAGWIKYFKLADLKALVTASQTGDLDAAGRSLVADISQKFDDAAKDPTYEVITKPWSFQTLQIALKEYALPPSDRQAHTLNAKTQTLKRSLDNISTGDGWKTYLMIDELGNFLSQSQQSNAELNTKLEKILERFDDVKNNPQYKIIAELQGFDVTRTGLQQYINAIQAAKVKQNVSVEEVESTSGKASL